MDQRVFFVFLVVCVYQSYCFYLITDYYMSQSAPWAGVCDKQVEDACAYINSHINNLRLTNYGNNRNCSMLLDAGAMKEARYWITFKYFQLQEPDDNGECLDYMEFYDGPAINESTFIGRYCGTEHPNVSYYITQRYVTVNFISDHEGKRDGFKMKVVRSEPALCQHDEFHCLYENRCIDGRLKCDGTQQCQDGLDEDDCNAWERFIGSILALGLGGIIGVGAGCFTGCTIIGVVLCACTCCQKVCCPCMGKKNHVNDVNINIKKDGDGKSEHDDDTDEKKKKKQDNAIGDTGDLRDLAMTPISIN